MLSNVLFTNSKNLNKRRFLRTKQEKYFATVPGLREQLTNQSELSHWLVGSCALELFGNHRLADFFKDDFDGRGVIWRFQMYNKKVKGDKDRIRMHGRYYNNIYLGKRIFGPARKQVFMYTIVGGMERRFEIVDNQVNHIQFTHEHSDKFVEKCRNQSIKCKDQSRVILSYPEEPSLDSFIHANHVNSPLLFNDFIITQAPMDNTIKDFWRMVWQERVCFIFMLISRSDTRRCAKYWPETVSSNPFQFHGLVIWNEGFEPSGTRDPFFNVTKLRIVGPNDKELRLEHWQGDLNNSQDLDAPLRLLRLSRTCTTPTVIHDHLGISRASCLVAIELTICQLLRGPMHKYTVQQSVHYLRFFRPFSVETPMQYIFIHRVVQHFLRPFVGIPDGFDQDYVRWMDERSQRLFIDSMNSEIPAFRLLSPKVDPDLLPLVRHRERPELRRELHAHVGELPLPADIGVVHQTAHEYPEEQKNPLANIQLPKRYPRGKRYD
uniref:Tyrosine-protein phosphatase domain-containing protein n=2 Tax=Meloidogyne TaxID=189290 RepID=A0A915NG96_9BILA